MHVVEDLTPLSVAGTSATSVSAQKKRRELGIYYTPDKASELIASWAIRTRCDVLLEPSFGGCSMLAAAVRRLQTLGCIRPSSALHGFDIDPQAAEHLRALLGDNAPPHMHVRDFLSVNPSERVVDAVLANPPFVSYRSMSDSQRESVLAWRSRFGTALSKEAGLWAYFVLHSLNFLKPGGRIGFVLPASIITADYCQSFLTNLTEKFDELTIIEVAERLFVSEGAQEKTCLLFADGYKTTQIPARCSLRHKKYTRLQEVQLSHESGQSASSDLREIAKESASLIKNLEDQKVLAPLGNFFIPTIGEVTGDIKFFVKSLREWDDLAIPRSDLAPLLTRSSQLKGLLARRTDETPYLLHPRDASPSKAVKRYLDSYPRTLRETVSTFKKRSPWWKVSYDSSAAAFIPSLHHTYLKIITNDAQIGCSNALYKLHSRVKDSPSAATSIVALSTLTQLSGELLSRSLGGGALKLEPSDVRRLAVSARLGNIERTQLSQATDELDGFIRNGLSSLAIEFADQLLLELGGIDTAQMQRAQELLSFARDLRLRVAS